MSLVNTNLYIGTIVGGIYVIDLEQDFEQTQIDNKIASGIYSIL
jgi:hypothetical protein